MAMRVLVVDDEPVARRILERILSDNGYEPLVVENGAQAWQVFQEIVVSLVITDWVMPDMDGLELVRRIRAARRPAYTYSILLSAKEGRSSFLEGMKAGADDFLSKPIDQETLLARLRVAERVLGLERTVTQLKELLPICSYCQSIRVDDVSWAPIDQYLASQTNSRLSHGVCPTCATRHFDPILR